MPLQGSKNIACNSRLLTSKWLGKPTNFCIFATIIFYKMKKLFYLLFLLPFFAAAQKVITHTVGPKESLSSIGRLYNVNGRELANYNKIDYNKGLSIGQVLKIPVKDGAVTPAPQQVKPTVAAKETALAKETAPVKTPVISKGNGTPIYHTVAKKETLYHISTLYKKVSIADIKKWNNLTSDALSEGAQIIVGYTNSKAAPVTKAPAEKKVEEIVEAPKTKKEETANPKKPEEGQANNVKKEIIVPVKNTQAVEAPVIAVKGADFKGGIFKNIFEEQTKGKQLVNETGQGGIFKSTSGWEDGKYYCLHNAAPAGTILKITNNATGKSVYAKVLDLITDIRQNNGLVVRVSNAAADALGVVDNKLDCTINYSK